MDQTGNLDGHLSEGTEVTGTLRFEGSVRIDGKFDGKILSPATLILGPRARVDGEVQVGELAVHGQLRGQVRALERVTIHGTGRVEAELHTARLVIEEGAFYQGRCDMESEKPPQKSQAPSPAVAPKSAPGQPPANGPQSTDPAAKKKP